MDEEIKRFRESNGNLTYSTKELIQGLHTKIDDINKRSRIGDKEVSRLGAWKNAIMVILTGAWMAIGYLFKLR